MGPQPELNNAMRHVWLYISSFGVMFAVLSWFQESGVLASATDLEWKKGLLAAVLGIPVYFFIALQSDGK
jgi:hypothetical protein